VTDETKYAGGEELEAMQSARRHKAGARESNRNAWFHRARFAGTQALLQ